MLTKLFGSNARAKLLKTFLFNPEERYYIRQLSRDLELQVNSVRRELENLESFGLLISEIVSAKLEKVQEAEKAIRDLNENINTEEITEEKEKPKTKAVGQDKKYFRINKTFPLFEDIKSLIVKSQSLYKDDFIQKLKEVGDIKLLVLTGVFVNKLDAVVDLFIVGEIDKEKLKETISGLEEELGREINFTVMEEKEFKYRRDIMDIFIYDLLDGDNFIVIDELGITK